MKKNVLRELLKDGKPTLSTRMLTTSPQIVEMIGHSGAFDFIELLGEYASWTIPDFENFARAVVEAIKRQRNAKIKIKSLNEYHKELKITYW